MVSKYILILLSLIFVFTSCMQNDSFRIEDTVSIDLIYDWKTVVIDEKIDIKNIVSIINTMDSNTLENEIRSDGRGYFITENDKIPFAFGDETIRVGKYEYYGLEQYKSIKNIFNKNKYNKNLVVDSLDISERITVNADDMDLIYEMKDKDKENLLSIIKDTEIKWDQTPNSLVPDYPYYSLELIFRDETTSQLIVIDNNNIILNDKSFGWEQFTTSSDLWIYLLDLVEPNLESDENRIMFLFNSSELLIENSIYKGDYSHKRNDLIRVLASNEGSNANVEKVEVQLVLTFIINGTLFNVDIYENGFNYKDVYYIKADVYNNILTFLVTG